MQKKSLNFFELVIKPLTAIRENCIMVNAASGNVASTTKSLIESRLSVPTIPNSIHVERGDNMKKDSLKKTFSKKRSPPPAKGKNNKKAATGNGTGQSGGGESVGPAKGKKNKKAATGNGAGQSGGGESVGGLCVASVVDAVEEKGGNYNEMMGFNMHPMMHPMMQFSPPVLCYFCLNLGMNSMQSCHDASMCPNRSMYYRTGQE
jgi:hypothetical protein